MRWLIAFVLAAHGIAHGVYLNLGLAAVLIVSSLIGLGWFPTAPRATTEAPHVASYDSLPR